MTKLLSRIYSIYAGLIFAISFLCVFPLLLLSIAFPSWKKYGRKINRFWAKTFFTLIFLPVEIEGQAKLEKGKPYIFLANHFSYLDIPMMGLIPGDVLYVGKNSIGKVPLFGFYFRKLHIAVNRNSLKSRAETSKRVGMALDQASSVIIFPEGGILTKNPPNMIPFKNGAFKLSIEKQIPIIPVTLSYNHLILPDDGKLLLRWRKAKMVLHPQLIAKAGEKENSLKATCFQTIQNQLYQDNALL